MRLAAASGAPVVFVATGAPGDEEMAARIELHREERPPDWTTVEEPRRLLDAVTAAPDGSCLVVDCLSLWIANLIEREPVETIRREALAAAAAAAGRPEKTIAVTNEVGLGIVPATPLGRVYRDLLGHVNQTWVAVADEALLVVAGRGLRLVDA